MRRALSILLSQVMRFNYPEKGFPRDMQSIKCLTFNKKKLSVISAVSWIEFCWHAWIVATYRSRANRDCRSSTVHRGTHTHTHFLSFKLSPSHPHTPISVSLSHLAAVVIDYQFVLSFTRWNTNSESLSSCFLRTNLTCSNCIWKEKRRYSGILRYFKKKEQLAHL